jgi:acyl carrier protein
VGEPDVGEVVADRPSEVLETVVGMIVGMLGEYVEEGLDIGRDTTFHDDLELESVDLVTLADLLMERYGPQVNLAEYFAEKDLDEVIAMTVGEVVDYVEQARHLLTGPRG